MATGCLRSIEKINICIKLAKISFLVTAENMGLCLCMKHDFNFEEGGQKTVLQLGQH